MTMVRQLMFGLGVLGGLAAAQTAAAATLSPEYLAGRWTTGPVENCTRAEHEHGRALLAAAAIEAPFAEGAQCHARAREERDEHERVEHVLAIAQHAAQPGAEEHEGDGHRAGQDREDDALDVRQARVAPDALVHAEEVAHEALQRHGHQQREADPAVERRNRVAAQQGESAQPAEHEGDGVVAQGREGARVELERLHGEHPFGSIEGAPAVVVLGPGEASWRRGGPIAAPIRPSASDAAGRSRPGRRRKRPPTQRVYRDAT